MRWALVLAMAACGGSTDPGLVDPVPAGPRLVIADGAVSIDGQAVPSNSEMAGPNLALPRALSQLPRGPIVIDASPSTPIAALSAVLFDLGELEPHLVDGKGTVPLARDDQPPPDATIVHFTGDRDAFAAALAGKGGDRLYIVVDGARLTVGDLLPALGPAHARFGHLALSNGRPAVTFSDALPQVDAKLSMLDASSVVVVSASGLVVDGRATSLDQLGPGPYVVAADRTITWAQVVPALESMHEHGANLVRFAARATDGSVGVIQLGMPSTNDGTTTRTSEAITRDGLVPPLDANAHGDQLDVAIDPDVTLATALPILARAHAMFAQLRIGVAPPPPVAP